MTATYSTESNALSNTRWNACCDCWQDDTTVSTQPTAPGAIPMLTAPAATPWTQIILTLVLWAVAGFCYLWLTAPILKAVGQVNDILPANRVMGISSITESTPASVEVMPDTVRAQTEPTTPALPDLRWFFALALLSTAAVSFTTPTTKEGVLSVSTNPLNTVFASFDASLDMLALTSQSLSALQEALANVATKARAESVRVVGVLSSMPAIPAETASKPLAQALSLDVALSSLTSAREMLAGHAQGLEILGAFASSQAEQVEHLNAVLSSVAVPPAPAAAEGQYRNPNNEEVAATASEPNPAVQLPEPVAIPEPEPTPGEDVAPASPVDASQPQVTPEAVQPASASLAVSQEQESACEPAVTPATTETVPAIEAEEVVASTAANSPVEAPPLVPLTTQESEPEEQAKRHGAKGRTSRRKPSR